MDKQQKDIFLKYFEDELAANGNCILDEKDTKFMRTPVAEWLLSEGIEITGSRSVYFNKRLTGTLELAASTAGIKYSIANLREIFGNVALFKQKIDSIVADQQLIVIESAERPRFKFS